MGKKEREMNGKKRIMIYGPKTHRMLAGVQFYIRFCFPDTATADVRPVQASTCTSGYAWVMLIWLLNFRGNEHVPPRSYTDLWPDNCSDSRLLGLSLSAAGPDPTRYRREVSECGSGA